MKILPVEKIREADAFTIKHEPIADIDLMERAATELFEWIITKVSPDIKLTIFCGLGNNGGDGFALARMLAEKKFNVEIYILWYSDKMSPSCLTNFKRAKEIKNLKISELHKEDKLPHLPDSEVIVDAIFGSGLTRPVEGFIANVINLINDSKAIVISVDVPSGFYCDQTNAQHKGFIINADYTLSFQFPKYGFLFPENDKYVGDWEILNIGLHPDYVNKIEVQNFFITKTELIPLLKPRTKFSHKGTFGHGLLIAGSYGKMGAAVLAAKSGLKAGAGLITSHVPKSGNVIMQTAVPSAMTSIDEDDEVFSKQPKLLNYSAIAVGPGIGTNKITQNALKLLIQNSKCPIIFDADAINILGENKTWISFIPKESIFTPHPKEFERLVGKTTDDFDRNNKQREFSIKYGMYIILKGAHTAISCPDGTCYFNSTGNPGMATAGSGDVLTGIILGLKAQGYSSKIASIMGVFIHGLAGDLAAEKWGFIALTSGNISHNIGKAFKRLQGLK